MASYPEAPPQRDATTASPIDRHASPVSDHATAGGKTRHGRATAALIVSILGILFAILFSLLGLILGIIGTVLAATARNDIRRRGMAGAGQAKAALICGIIAIGLSVAMIVLAAIAAST
jgi:hypothetical protein